MLKKDAIIVHTEKEFLEALKNIDENTLIIFNDQRFMISKNVDAREYEKNGGN